MEVGSQMINPYPQGNWLTVEKVKPQTSSASKSPSVKISTDSGNRNSEETREKDLVLRGPLWNYNRIPCSTDDEHYDYLLFRKLKKSLFAQNEFILNGETWEPAKPIKLSFAEYLLRCWEKNDPDSTALLEVETGRTMTFRELIEKARSLSAGLRWIGLMPRQIVAIVSYCSMEAVLVLFATQLAGAIPAPIDSTLNPGELGTLLRIVQPRMVFTEGGKTMLKVETALSYLMTPRHPQLIINSLKPTRHWTVGRLMREEEALPLEARGADLHRPILIIFTSGLTGSAKAALMPERYFMCSQIFLESPFTRRDSAITMMITGPISWASPLTTLYNSVVRGNRVVFYRGLPPTPVVVDSFRRYEVYLWITGPSHLLHLLHWPARPRCPALKVVVVCGSMFQLPSYNAVRDQLFHRSVDIIQLYGMSESGVLTSNTSSQTNPRSIGKPFCNCQLKVIDKVSGLPLGPNQEGQLCFTSPTTMLGYYNNVEDSWSVFDAQGFLLTGDLGYYDDEGWVYMTGQLKNLIKSRLYPVSPGEIEAQLIVMPAVREAVVVGIPDELEGELVAAAVTLNHDELPRSIEQFVNSNLSTNKWIRGGVHVFHSLPRLASGKPNRHEITQMIMERGLEQAPTESIYSHPHT